jgi:hypothetical protein
MQATEESSQVVVPEQVTESVLPENGAREPAAQGSGNRLVTTQAAVARAFGVSGAAVVEWLSKGCPGKNQSGQYDIDAILAWRSTHIRGTRRRSDSPTWPAEGPLLEDPSPPLNKEALYRTAEIEEKIAKAELAKLKLQMQKRELIPISEIKQRDVARIQMVKSGLFAMPRRLAQEMEGMSSVQREVVMRTRFRELLERFARM